MDVRQIGKELGVRYVLEGSIRKASGRIRVSIQLTDSATGAHIWAERFEDVLEDVFALQDNVANSVARAIAPTVKNVEIARARRKRPANLSAYDYYLGALPHWYASTRKGSDEALRLLDQALTLDPTFAQALSVKALVLAYRSTLGWTQPVTARRTEMLARSAIPPQSNQSSKRLFYPAVTDPEDPPIRPERHVTNSIATLSSTIARALAQTLLRCPCMPAHDAASKVYLVTHKPQPISGAGRASV